ncbi:MAG: hypothetical protein ACRES8_05955 [Nevskiaceae bacterium]
MTNLKLNTTLVAASLALSLLAPAAQAQTHQGPVAVPTAGQTIAAQGNAALKLIRAELQAAFKPAKPRLPARATKVAAPGASSAPATAALAE